MSRGNTIPKRPGSRQRRNAAIAFTELDEAPKNAPPLPNRSEFLPPTRRWYDAWATSPMATQFAATDWQRLHMVALLVDKFFRSPDASLLGEIRLNEKELGGTVEARLRLRWNLPLPPTEEAIQTDQSRKRREDPRLKLVSPDAL